MAVIEKWHCCLMCLLIDKREALLICFLGLTLSDHNAGMPRGYNYHVAYQLQDFERQRFHLHFGLTLLQQSVVYIIRKRMARLK